jgi:hypothetical protein
MILLVHFLDGSSFSIRRQGDGRPMRISTADHQHAIPLEPVVTRNNVARQV